MRGVRRQLNLSICPTAIRTALVVGLMAVGSNAVEARLTRRVGDDVVRRKPEEFKEARAALLVDEPTQPSGAAPKPEQKRTVLRRQVVAETGLEALAVEKASAPELAPGKPAAAAVGTDAAPVGIVEAERTPKRDITRAEAADEPVVAPVALLQVRGRSNAGSPVTFFLESFLKPGRAICGCALVVAFFAWLTACWTKCCGENSCLHRCSCWKAMRLKAGLDDFEQLNLALTIHRCRDFPTGDQLFVAVFPRRSSGSSKPPKLDKGAKTVRTAKTTDLIWEQELTVRVEQGYTSLQVVLYKTARIGKGTMLGWDRIKISDVLKQAEQEGEKKASWSPDAKGNKHWLTLHGDDGQRVGSLQVTVSLKKDGAGGRRSDRSSGEDTDHTVPRSLTAASTADFSSELDACAQALCGPLYQADKLGDYQLRWFRLEMKRGVAAWAWYQQQYPAPGTKPISRIPVLSITLVHPVPKSASEFVLRYSNQNRRMVDMMLQRQDRPREKWIAALHRCIEVVRAERQALTQQKRDDEVRATASSAGSPQPSS